MAAEKKLDTEFTYEANVIVLSICNTGSTYAGAYREAVDAAVFKAIRIGKLDRKGAVKAENQGRITLVRKLDPKLFSTNE